MAPQTAVRGDFDIRAFYAAVDAARQTRGLSWAAVMREINDRFRDVTGARRVAASTITGMRERKSMIEGDSGLQVLLWLGLPPEAFVPGGRVCDPLPAMHTTAKILRWNTRAVFAAMDAERQARGLKWQDVAAQIGGFTPAMLTRLSKGGRTSFPGIMRIVGWLDRPAADFTVASDA